jgi:hypothetical protein
MSAPNSLPHVCPSARMQQLGSHWTDFREILNLSIFRKTVEKIQVSLKYGQKLAVYMRPYVHYDISPYYFYNYK